jgi:predicted lipoprotein with Yx(FWY)xxD motif
VRHPIALGAPATILALTLAACGSSSKTATTASSAAGTAAPAAATASSTSTTTTAAATTAGETIATKHDKLGTVLAAGPKQMTVYLFEGDRSAASSCTGACAHVWPPVTSAGRPAAAGGAVAADLGTIARPDGTMQVTYKGHPLYFFAKDGDKGDAYGQGVNGFGASWYVLSPGGSKVDKS